MTKEWFVVTGYKLAPPPFTTEILEKQQKRLRYKDIPCISDYHYYYIKVSDYEARSEVATVLADPSGAFNLVKTRHDINIQTIDANRIDMLNVPSQKVPYFLIGPVKVMDLFSDDGNIKNNHHIILLIQKLKKRHPNARINLFTFFYSEESTELSPQLQKAKILVPKLDRKLGVNTIYPDNSLALPYPRSSQSPKIRTVSAKDIADNIVCETIRVKYRARREESDSAQQKLFEVQQQYKQLILTIKDLFRKFNLYHRAPTDGAVMIKTKYGWLVSQTHTDKTNMSPLSFSLVTNYNPKGNTITFVGSKLPSSDAPEFMRTFDEKEVATDTIVIHFHKSELTRGNKDTLNLHRTKKVIEYGRFESAEEVRKEINAINDNWLILKEHGLVWWGSKVDEFKQWLESNCKC